MRSLSCAVAICCFLAPVFSGASDEAGPGEEGLYEPIVVSPSVVMALHDNGSNISCVALDEGLVFFDAGLSTRTATAFRREMEARFQRPAVALVLTHAHLDHLFGMAAFDDVPVYAAEAGRPRWEHFVAMEWDERAIAGYAAVFPTLPDEIADAVQEAAEPSGVGVVVEAYHLCMMMRGVEKQNSKTITSAVRGRFRSDNRTREEFLRLVLAPQFIS